MRCTTRTCTSGTWDGSSPRLCTGIRSPRVVPSGFDPKDPNEVKYLVDKGYINDTWRSPDKQDIHFVTEAMGRLVAAHGRELRARYGLQNRASWTATDSNVSSLQWVQAGWEVDDKLGYVYQDNANHRS